MWKYVQECSKIDLQNHENGTGLDEAMAHRFLELLGETLTVMALRDSLRKSGAISPTERPKTVPLTHYALFKYGVDWKKLVNTKGDNSAELAEAQRLLDQVGVAFQEAEKQAGLARQAENEARTAEAPFKAAQEELETALAEVKAQEDSYNNKKSDLERKSNEGNVVQQNKAKAELAQLLAEDPLPLRKAKITQQAAVKKAEKARAPFDAATKVAEAARQKAEDAVESCKAKLAEAEAYLKEVSSKPGNPHGAIWWVGRELEEKKKYLPTSKGGKAK